MDTTRIAAAHGMTTHGIGADLSLAAWDALEEAAPRVVSRDAARDAALAAGDSVHPDDVDARVMASLADAIGDEQARILRRATEARMVPMVDARKMDVTVTSDWNGQLVLAGFHFRVEVTFRADEVVADRFARDSRRHCGVVRFDSKVGPADLAQMLLAFAD